MRGVAVTAPHTRCRLQVRYRKCGPARREVDRAHAGVTFATSLLVFEYVGDIERLARGGERAFDVAEHAQRHREVKVATTLHE